MVLQKIYTFEEIILLILKYCKISVKKWLILSIIFINQTFTLLCCEISRRIFYITMSSSNTKFYFCCIKMEIIYLVIILAYFEQVLNVLSKRLKIRVFYCVIIIFCGSIFKKNKVLHILNQLFLN